MNKRQTKLASLGLAGMLMTSSIPAYAVSTDIAPLATTATYSYRYSLTCDKHLEVTQASGSVSDAETTVLRITPDDNYAVSRFIIQVGSEVKTVYADETQVKVGKQTFLIYQKPNGKVELTLPAADKNSAETTIIAASETASHTIAIAGTADVACNMDSGSKIKHGENATLIFTPRSGNTINSLEISINGDSETVPVSESKVVIDGKAYTLQTTPDGTVYLYLTAVYADVSVQAITDARREHTLYVATDSGITCEDAGEHELEDSASMTLKFQPLFDYSIASITVTANGESDIALNGDTSVRVAGKTYSVSWSSNGKATLNLNDIDESMEVYAASDMTNEIYYIQSKPDDNSSIYVDSENKNYIDKNEDFSVRVQPNYGYDITNVTITANGKSIPITSETDSFVMNGHEYFVEHQGDGTVYIRFPYISTSIALSSTSAKQEEMHTVQANSGALNDNYNMGGTATCTVTGGGNIGDGKPATITFTPNVGQDITKINLRDSENRQNLIDAAAKSATIDGTTYAIDKTVQGVVTITCDSVVDNVFITALTETMNQAGYYTVTLQSGTADGETLNTCKTSGAGDVKTGGKATFAFAPNDGYDIAMVNLQHGADSKLCPAKTGTVYLGGAMFQILSQDGALVIACDNVQGDITATAVTTPQAKQYNLDIDTDSHIDCDTKDTTITDSETKKITFTPDKKYSVSKLVITDGKDKETIFANESSVKVNGNTYKLTKKSTGAVVLEIPKASADVSVSAYSQTGTYLISYPDDSAVTANVGEETWAEYGDDMTIVLYPRMQNEIETIKLTIGNDTEKVKADEDSFKIDGKTYEMEQANDGTVYIYLTNIYSDVNITAVASSEDGNVLLVDSDEGIYCSAEGESFLENGDDLKLTFPKQWKK